MSIGTGRRRGLSTSPSPKERRQSTRSIWDLASSLQAANDQFDNLLVQDEPPLPLLPNIMGKAEDSSPLNSHHPASQDYGTESQTDIAMCDSPIGESYLQDIDMCPIPCTAAPGPQDAQATHGLFNSCSDHQDGGTFELIESPSHYTHSSLLELGFSEFEEQFPDMCAMVEPMSPSTCGHVDAGNTLSDPEAAHMQSSSSQDTQQGHSEELYSLQMMTGSEPQEEAYVQAQEGSQTSSSASNLYSDYQGTFDCITVSDGYTDQSGAEPRQEENEDEDGVQDDPGQATQTVEHSVPDPGNVGTNETAADTTTAASTRCWDHGCNGRQFSTRSNLLRHQIEKGKARPNFKCPTCGAFFSRTTARNQHVAKNSCNRVRRYSNGRERPGPRVVDKS